MADICSMWRLAVVKHSGRDDELYVLLPNTQHAKHSTPEVFSRGVATVLVD